MRFSPSATFRMPPICFARCTTARNGATATSASKSRPTSRRDTKGSLEEARRLWKAVGRENVMIKIPGTAEGIPAIQQAISEGININVTLLFAQDVYVKVAEAYIAGLEQFAKNGGDVSRMASVASFFISRIDTAVDAIIDTKLKASKDAARARTAEEHSGKSRDRQRQTDVREIPGDFQHSALEGPGRQRSADPARALGQHQHQEPGLSRCAVRRRIDRAGHGRHHSACHPRRVPRSWKAASKSDRGSCRGPYNDGDRRARSVFP